MNKHTLNELIMDDPTMLNLIQAALNDPSSPLTLPTKSPTSKYLEELLCSITSQQLSVKAAATIWKRFQELVGHDYAPENILKFTPEQLRFVGLSGQKSKYILGICEDLLSGRVDITNLDELADQEVVSELVKLKGVGVWTAEMFLIGTLARPDVFSVLDLGLRNAVSKAYSTPEKPINPSDHTTILTLSQTWSPHRSLASLALWHSLDNI
jgi:DNA-3-methyladenine glycosylase II